MQHIRHTHAKHSKKSWCGEDLVLAWAFVDVDHALYTLAQNGSVPVCQACLDAVKAVIGGKKWST